MIKTKEEIWLLERASMHPYNNITAAVYPAMDIWARQQAIEFLKWLIRNDKVDFRLAYELGYSEDKMVEEFPDLYNIFLQNQQSK